MKLTIFVNLKPEILDPQGEAIANSLNSLGFNSIRSIRQGKIIVVDLEESDKEVALIQGKEMCKSLLVNGVIEDFSITVE